MQIVAFKDALPIPRPDYSRVFRVESLYNPMKGAYCIELAREVNYWDHMPTPLWVIMVFSVR